MVVDILLEKHSDSQCTISSCPQKEMCRIKLKRGNTDISCVVSIEDLRRALRKLCTK